MGRTHWPLALAVLAAAPLCAAEVRPLKLAVTPQEPPSVYALPAPGAAQEPTNAGGVNINMNVRYMTDYVYRGIDIPELIGDITATGSDSQASFQFDGRISFDLGKLPHPFIGIFTNVLDNDPVTNFEEIRPIVGFEWTLRPLTIEAGNILYSYPDRNELNTSEVYGRITLDDTFLFRSREPWFTPYILAAYDYDNANGWYFEAGVSHRFVVEDTGLSITALANIGYVMNQDYFRGPGPDGDDTGFQHYEVGMIASYSLNTLLNISQRHGQWSLNGYLFYTDGIDDDVRASTRLYGGAGIDFRY